MNTFITRKNRDDDDGGPMEPKRVKQIKKYNKNTKNHHVYLSGKYALFEISPYESKIEFEYIKQTLLFNGVYTTKPLINEETREGNQDIFLDLFRIYSEDITEFVVGNCLYRTEMDLEIMEQLKQLAIKHTYMKPEELEAYVNSNLGPQPRPTDLYRSLNPFSKKNREYRMRTGSFIYPVCIYRNKIIKYISNCHIAADYPFRLILCKLTGKNLVPKIPKSIQKEISTDDFDNMNQWETSRIKSDEGVTEVLYHQTVIKHGEYPHRAAFPACFIIQDLDTKIVDAFCTYQ